LRRKLEPIEALTYTLKALRFLQGGFAMMASSMRRQKKLVDEHPFKKRRSL
jgi:hypothetical protein